MQQVASRHTESYLWCAFFVLMEAFQTVYFGTVLQQISPFLLGSAVFGISSAISVALSIWFDPEQLGRIRAHLWPLLRVNLFGTIAWLSYLFSMKNIEPAVAFTVFSASIPLTIIYLENTRQDAIGRFGSMLLFGSIGYLGIISVLGFTGFQSAEMHVTALSILGCAVAGVSISVVLLQSKALNLAGLSSLSVFGLRFILFALLSGLAYLFFDAGTAPFNPDVAWIIFLGVLLLALPLYAVQRAIDIADARTVGVFTAFTPLGVVLLQVIENRVEFSIATVVGICVYATGAVMLAFNEVKKKNHG